MTTNHGQTHHLPIAALTSPSPALPDEPKTLPVTADQRPDPPASVTPAMVVQRGPNTGTRFLLDRPTTTVGRHPHSDVFLDDITVSRRHAELRIDDTGVHVVDLDSLRGTYLNGTPIHTALLIDGDHIHIGKFHLTFSQE